MQERIIEIIIYVVSALKNNNHFEESDIKELIDLGYTNAEISTAFSWIADSMDTIDKLVPDVNTSKASFRILHEIEKDLFTTEALGEIIQMITLGIITNENLESMIERAILLGIRQIDSKQIKAFVAGLIVGNQQTVPSIRLMLTGNETIN